MRTLLTALFALAIAIPCGATTYYVSPSGSDSNNGQAATVQGGGVGPWRTLPRAASLALAGDTVLIRAGTYFEAEGLIDPDHSGADGSPITFRAYPGEHPLQDGNANGLPIHQGYNCIIVQPGRNYFVFDGLAMVRGMTYYGAIELFNHSLERLPEDQMTPHHVTIQNCSVSNMVNTSDNASGHMCAIKFNTVRDITVRNSRFNDIRTTDGDPGHTGISYFTSRLTIENCEIYNMTVAYIDKAECHETTYRRNYVHDVSKGYDGNCSPGANTTLNTKIYENVFRNAQYAAIGQTARSPNTRAFNNSIWEGNIQGSDGGSIIFMSTLDNQPSHFWNNVTYGTVSRTDLSSWWGCTEDTSPYLDYNCYYPDLRVACGPEGRNYIGLPAWQAGGLSQLHGWDQHSIEQNPLFATTPPTGPQDFHLQAGSPCVHAGVDHLGDSPGYASGAPDMGAYPRGNDGTVVGLLPTGAPYISITTPTGSGSYTTSQSTVAIGGTASDSDGNVTSVTWVNSTGGSGTASGTTAWAIASVALASGDNTITVTAHDDGGNVNTVVIIVTYSTTPADTTPPYVAQQSPASGATGVALDANITCHVLDAGAGVNQSSIVVRVNGGTVSPTISGTAADLVVFYNPPANFSALQTVTVSIAADDHATTPNHLSTSWSFTTIDPVAPDTTPPYVEQQSPAPGATGVARNAVIRFHVRDTGSGVNQGSVSVTVNGSPVNPTFSGTPADLDVICDPAGDFASLQVVNVVVNASDSATTPNAMTAVSWSFTCSAVVIEPPPAPSNLAVYPSTNLLVIQFSASAGPNVAGYYLYYRNGTVGYVKVNIGNVTSYVLTGLTAGATYHLQVTAYDTADQESDPTAEVGATVLGLTDGDDDDDDGHGETETPVKDLEVRPNRVSLRDGVTVEIVGPADALAGETVKVYGVSGGYVGETTLEDDGSKEFDPAADLPMTAGVYILYAGGEYRARLVITP